MSVPTVNSVNSGSESVNTSTHTVNLPPTVNAGELLLVFMSFDGNPTVTWDNTSFGTWTQLVDTPSGTAAKLVIYAKVAIGTEDGGTLSIGTDVSEQSTHQSQAIGNWQGTIASGVNSPTAATGTTDVPDPPAATDGWGNVDRKTIAVYGADGSRTATAYPTNYDLDQATGASGGGAGAGIGSAGRNQAAAGSQDPGTFTISAADDWIAATVSVRGSAGAAASSSKPAYIKGQASALDNQPAYVKGQASASDNQSAYVAGQDNALDNQPAYIQGQDSASDSQSAYIAGQDSASDSQSAYIAGQSSATDNQSAFIAGVSAYALRPDGDVTVGTWQNELGGTTLYTSIDEPVPVDTDYVWHNAPPLNSYFEVSLTNPAGNVPANNHYLRWRARRIGGTLTTTIKCELRQGASTVIVSDEQTLNNDNFQTFEKQLSAGEIASITDYDDLRLRFTVTGLT